MLNDSYPSGTIIGLFIGKVASPWPDKKPSAITKHLVEGPQFIGELGFAGDEHADLTVHGGLEKAIHHYASEHMSYWKEKFPDNAAQFNPGCFGENISSTGLDENNLCLGDVLTLGSAKVQVCQGRQPCWKLNAHTGLNAMAAEFQKSGRTGWYFRVLQNGTAVTGDRIRVVERPCPDWPLQRVIEARFNSRLDIQVAKEISEISALSQSWQEAFAKKSKAGFRENTDARLKGSTP